MLIKKFTFLIFVLLSFASNLWASHKYPPILYVPVIGIIDGNTIIVLIEDKEKKVRLAEVDTPEQEEPYYKQAKDFTLTAAYGHTVKLVKLTTDTYDRIVARVFLEDNSNLSEALVRAGLARIHPNYSKYPKLIKLEAEAKAAKRGIWSAPTSIAPWESIY